MASYHFGSPVSCDSRVNCQTQRPDISEQGLGIRILFHALGSRESPLEMRDRHPVRCVERTIQQITQLNALLQQTLVAT